MQNYENPRLEPISSVMRFPASPVARVGEARTAKDSNAVVLQTNASLGPCLRDRVLQIAFSLRIARDPNDGAQPANPRRGNPGSVRGGQQSVYEGNHYKR